MRIGSTLLATILIATLTATPALGHPTTIGLFFDTAASDCDATVAVGEPFDVYVLAVLGTDGASDGIEGAQFRVTGFEPTWMAQFVPNPAAYLVLGDPLVCVSNLAFPCQMKSPVFLGTIHATMNPPATPHILKVEGECAPTMVGYRLFVVKCDPPIWTKVPCTGGEVFLNGGACSVATVPTTWTAVREMFR